MSTTLFKEVGYSLSNLMDNIEMGQETLAAKNFAMITERDLSDVD